MTEKLQFKRPDETKQNSVKVLADIIIDLYNNTLDGSQGQILKRVGNDSDKLSPETMKYLISGLLSNTHDIITAREIGRAIFRQHDFPIDSKSDFTI